MWPANIAPQTPSALYGGVNLVQPATGPSVLYVRLRGQAYQTVIGAKSRGYIDLPFYDTSVTRDIIDASTTGRGAMSVLTGTGSPGSDISTPNGDVIFVGGPTALTPAPDQIATMQQQSDPFTHTPSHQVVKAVTEVRYYDGVLVTNEPSGNLVASWTRDQWEGDGSTIPQLTGSPYPTINPADNNTDGAAT